MYEGRKGGVYVMSRSLHERAHREVYQSASVVAGGGKYDHKRVATLLN